MILRIKAVLVAFGMTAVVACNTGGDPTTSNAGDAGSNAPALDATATGGDEAQAATRPADDETPVVRVTDTDTTLPAEQPEVVDLTALQNDISEDLQRLQDLELFEVGELVAGTPLGRMNCYVCPEPSDDQIDGWVDAAARLDMFVEIAESAVDSPAGTAACEADAIDANLQLIADLNVIEVGGLLVVEPAASANCYNMPCAADIVAAEEETCDRARALAAVAEDAHAALGQGTVDVPAAGPSAAMIAAAVEAVDANLQTLRELEVVEVYSLVVDVPDEAFNCYGACPGWEDEIQAATETSALALEELTASALAVAELPVAEGACAPDAIDTNLEALAGLDVVHIGGLIAAQPEANPMCYNLPCQEDIEAAEAETCRRAGVLANIVDAAE